MDQHYLVNYYGLKCGDRLVRGKGVLSKHHGIYVGYHNCVPMVAENQNGKGVQYVSLFEFLLWGAASLERIEPFKGSEEARRNVIPRINKLVGTQYDLINFNCEHFAELIQNGKASSKQVNNALWGLGIIAVLGIMIAASE